MSRSCIYQRGTSKSRTSLRERYLLSVNGREMSFVGSQWTCTYSHLLLLLRWLLTERKHATMSKGWHRSLAKTNARAIWLGRPPFVSLSLKSIEVLVVSYPATDGESWGVNRTDGHMWILRCCSVLEFAAEVRAAYRIRSAFPAGPLQGQPKDFRRHTDDRS
jgi:hypothetical protein